MAQYYTYQQMKETLEQESGTFDIRLQSLKKQLQEASRNLSELETMAGDASKIREQAKLEVVEMERRLSEERRSRERQLAQRRQVVQSRLEVNERMERRVRDDHVHCDHGTVTYACRSPGTCRST